MRLEGAMSEAVWADLMGAIVKYFTSKENNALVIGLVVLFSGQQFLHKINADSPFKKSASAIAGLVFLAPLIIVFSVTSSLPTEAITGFIGTIVGYFFGTAGKNESKRDSGSSAKLEQDTKI